MRWLYLLSAFLALPALAQESGDITYHPVQRRGDYQVRVLAASEGTPTARICLKRVDAEPPTLLACAAATPSQVITFNISVPVTPNNDAEIRAFAYDHIDDLVAMESEPSENAGILIFTPPGRPKVIP